MDNEDDVMLLREILARELETINNYLELSRKAKNPEVAAFIRHVTDEEKEHVAESMELINRLDQKQASFFGAASHWEDGASSRPASTRIDERALTVGSLRKLSKP